MASSLWDTNSFKLEVTGTDETNTWEEKTRYHRAAFDLLAALIDDVHPHSNIHIVDSRASAYGVVALLIRMDDLGLKLAQRDSSRM